MTTFLTQLSLIRSRGCD